MARAVRFDRYGDRDVLYVADVAVPEPATGEVVVEVRSAGINPGEAAIRNGALQASFPATFPSGEGSDRAGVVSSVGDGVTEFAVGDEVLGWSWRRSSHAEYVAVPVTQLIQKPAESSWRLPARLYVVGCTAFAAVRAVGAEQGDTVAVSGAAGGVGTVVVQLLVDAFAGSRRRHARLVADCRGQPMRCCAIFTASSRLGGLRERGVAAMSSRYPSLARDHHEPVADSLAFGESAVEDARSVRRPHPGRCRRRPAPGRRSSSARTGAGARRSRASRRHSSAPVRGHLGTVRAARGSVGGLLHRAARRPSRQPQHPASTFAASTAATRPVSRRGMFRNARRCTLLSGMGVASSQYRSARCPHVAPSSPSKVRASTVDPGRQGAQQSGSFPASTTRSRSSVWRGRRSSVPLARARLPPSSRKRDQSARRRTHSWLRRSDRHWRLRP